MGRQTSAGWKKTSYFRTKCVIISKTVRDRPTFIVTINELKEVADALSIETKILDDLELL